MKRTAETSRFLWRAFRSRFRDHKVELASIRRHIRPGGVVCDVGANKGSFVYWLSRWCPEGRVVAFEPQPDLAEYLSRVCAAAGLRNVTVEAKAVFSHSGQSELFVPEGHKPGASIARSEFEGARVTTVTVPTVSLDDYFGASERVSVLKIDVEGAEVGVFKGAERILREDGPLLIFECESRHLGEKHIDDVFAYLRSFGYEGGFVHSRRMKPVSMFDERVHQDRTGQWFWKAPGYCANFVFARPELA